MTRWIGAAVAILLGATLMFGGSATIDAAVAASGAAVQKPQAGQAADFSARHRVRHPPALRRSHVYAAAL